MQGTEVNDIQASILRQLFSNTSLRFSEINAMGVPSDQFSYHLRQLIKHGLVEKTSDQRYSLSILGRGRAVLLDARSNKFIEQGFVAARILLTRQSPQGKEYLMQIRSRVPFLGYLGEPGGKVLFGEDVAEAAKRNMIVETGLECEISIHGLAHFKDNYQGNIVQDKFFFLVKASNPRGTLKPAGPTGKNVWMTLDQIHAFEKVHFGVFDMIDICEGNDFGFIEETRVVVEY